MRHVQQADVVLILAAKANAVSQDGAVVGDARNADRDVLVVADRFRRHQHFVFTVEAVAHADGRSRSRWPAGE